MHEKLRSVSEKYFHNVKYLGGSVFYRLMRVWLHPMTLFYMTSTWRKQKIAVNNLHRFTDSIINERKAFWSTGKEKHEEINVEDDSYGGKKGRHAMLDLLLQSSAEGLIDSRGIREEVDTFMFEVNALAIMTSTVANKALMITLFIGPRHHCSCTTISIAVYS